MLRRFFSSNRRLLTASGTLVFFRTGLVFSASLSNSPSRSTTIARFAFCVRYRCETTLIWPCLLTRVASRLSIRFFWPSEKPAQFAKSKSSVTRVLTLFTFCPPGPPLRENLKTSSSSEMKILFLISITVCFPTAPCHPRKTCPEQSRWSGNSNI